MKIILRVPRNPQPAGSLRLADSSSGGGASLPETAVGVNGIELQEQTHEEALLSTIGAFPLGYTALVTSVGLLYINSPPSPLHECVTILVNGLARAAGQRR